MYKLTKDNIRVSTLKAWMEIVMIYNVVIAERWNIELTYINK